MLNTLLNGFTKYYNTLTKIGYINDSSVNNLIIASWIYDVLNGKYGFLVNEEQYKLIGEVLSCIEGTCLVPWIDYCKDVTVNKYPDLDRYGYVRITENTETRHLENDDIRTL